MKFNLLNRKRFLMGTIAAAALLVTPVAFKASGSAAEAQSGEGPFAALNLSEAQQSEIQTIRQDTRAQVESILTDAQRQQLAAAAEEGPGGLRDAMGSLELSEEQREQLRAVREDSRESFQAVLTPEQQQQLEEMHQERYADGQQGGLGRAAFGQLDLTEDQQAQLETIRSSARSQVEAVLTDDQRQQVEAVLQSNDSNIREAMQAANLTDEQRQQIRTIMENSRQEAAGVLTDEQRQQLEQMRPEGGPRSDRDQRLQRS